MKHSVRRRRRWRLAQRQDAYQGNGGVPSVEMGRSHPSTILSLFNAHKIVHVRKAWKEARRTRASWQSFLLPLCAQAECCVENAGTAMKHSVATMLRNGSKRFYFSFILRDARLLSSRVPTTHVPLAGTLASSPHAWVFVGNNAGPHPLAGRAEHTDALASHVLGTWHLQVAGTKDWSVRQAGSARRKVRCRQGDLLFIDTRYFYHATTLPPQRGLSISIARDFSNTAVPPAQAVTNIDATLAARDLRPGTIVLTEADLPNCALPRSSKPNCTVEMRHNVLCLVARHDIPSGEVLTVAESDDEGG